MLHLSKNVQYGIAGALAVYIVFFTRPAPAPVVSLLSNPLAQLAVLGAIVYVGATVSLLVALVAAVAVVLSIPAREYAGKEDDKTMHKKKTEPEDVKKNKKKADPEPAGHNVESKTESSGSEKFTSGGAPF